MEENIDEGLEAKFRELLLVSIMDRTMDARGRGDATGKDLNCQMDPRFGRCQYFDFVDPENMEFEAFEKPSLWVRSGAALAFRVVRSTRSSMGSPTKEEETGFLEREASYLREELS